jgi:hypothetical protein
MRVVAAGFVPLAFSAGGDSGGSRLLEQSKLLGTPPGRPLVRPIVQNNSSR